MNNQYNPQGQVPIEQTQQPVVEQPMVQPPMPVPPTEEPKQEEEKHDEGKKTSRLLTIIEIIIIIIIILMLTMCCKSCGHKKNNKIDVPKDPESNALIDTNNNLVIKFKNPKPIDFTIIDPDNPDFDNPDNDNPGGDNPGGNNPGGDNPGGNNPGGDNPGGNNPGGDNPGGNNPGGDNPGGNNPGGDNPGGDNPGGNNPGGDNPGTYPTNKPPVISDDNKLITFEVVLKKPGDKYGFTIEIENESEIDVKVDKYTSNTLTEEQAKYLDMRFTYADGTPIRKGDRIKSGETKVLKFVATYVVKGDKINENDVTAVYKGQISYIQAD